MGIFEPVGGAGGGGGAGGLTLGPPTNEFSGANRAAAETARDTYATNNAAWLAQYDAEPTFTISLYWPATNPTSTIYQSRRSSTWADVTGLIRGPRGITETPGYQRWIFQSALSQPAAPTTPSTVGDLGDIPGLPTGWTYAPPNVADPIWASLQTVVQGTTAVSYTAPDRWDGDDGSSADTLVVPLFSPGQQWREGELVSTTRGDVYIAQEDIASGSANSRVNPNDSTNALWEPIQGYVGSWARGGHYREGNIVEHSGSFYFTKVRTSNSQTAPSSDTTNFQLLSGQSLSDADVGEKAFKNPPSLNSTQQAAVRTAIGAGTGDTTLTDAQIGDKAFKNPPTLNDAQQTAVRAAIGAGSATSLDDLPIPAWASGNSYAVGELVRDPHDRVFMVITAVTTSSNAPATDATNFSPVSGFGGAYADSTAYPVGVLVTYSNNVYFVATAVAASNTDDPSTNNAFVQINGGGSGGTIVVANPDGTADGGDLNKITIGGTIYAIPAGGGDDSGGGPFATEIARANPGAPTASRVLDTNLDIPDSVGDDEWWGIQLQGTSGEALNVFKASQLTGLTNVTIGNAINANTSSNLIKFLSNEVSFDQTIGFGRTSDGDIVWAVPGTGVSPNPMVLYRLNAGGGTEVEANPAGAVDSGALTKLDVDGSIYSVGTGSGGIAGVTIEDEGTALTTAATTIDFTGAGVTATGNGATKTVNIPGDGDLSTLKSDTLVFYAPTSGHAAFDALDYGSTVTIVHGTSQTDAVVLSASRSGTVCTLVLEATDDWTAILNETTFQLQDDTDPTPNTITTLTVASRANDRDDVDTAGEFFADLDALTSGSEVWRDISRIDALDDTHLSLGTRTATTVPINSSTGDPVTIPVATTALAGAESAADKTQLTALPPTWVGGRVWPAGSHVAYQERTYSATTQREVADTDPPTTDTAWVDVADSGGATNLTVARSATTVTVESDSGTNAVILAASNANAGAYPASAHERVEASIDKWGDGAHTVGQQRVWNETAYICIADTSPGDGNPATDTTGWAPLASAPDLSGYATTAAIANFQTETEITTEISTAVADKLIDGGAYDATSAYTARTIVRHDGASYLALIAVAANTGATTEPGVGTAWETSWYRIGYEDGPPNAFISAALAGDNLTFTREGGTNPLTVDIGGVSGGSTLRVESVGVTAVDTPASNRISVPRQDWAQIEGFDATSVVEYGTGASEIAVRDSTDQDVLTIAPGVYQIEISCFIWSDEDRAAPIFEFRESGGSTVYGQSELAYVRNKTEDTGGSQDRGPTYDTNDDGTDDLGVALVRMHMMYVQTEERSVEIFAGSDPWIDNTNSGNTGISNRSGEPYQILPESLNIRFMRPGSGNPVVNNVFNPMDIGTDTFDLNGSATQVALTDDTSGNAIVIPNVGYILTIATVPGLGIRGQVQLHLAEDLQAATMEDGLTAQFYTNTDNELFFGAGPQTGGTATIGNKIIVQRVGSTTDTSSGGTTVINPSILRFDVTGENHPSVASIAGDVFNVVGEISQSGHVGSADVVGFAGTSHDPSTVSTLLSNAQITAAGGYHHFTGRLTIPAGTELTNVGDIYTIRLRVWPTGGDTSTAPTIYHDYRITRVAASAVTHFGHIPFLRSDGSTHTDASDVTGFTNDISTAGSAIGDWTIDGLVEGDGERRLYWAVPATDTQPAVWINSGTTVTDIIDVPSGAQNIGGVSYRVYVTNRQFDDFANGTTYTTRSS